MSKTKVPKKLRFMNVLARGLYAAKKKLKSFKRG
jgi:hypothetical protein